MSSLNYQGISHDTTIVHKLMKIFPVHSQLVCIPRSDLLTTSIVIPDNLSSFHICILSPDCNLTDNFQQELLHAGSILSKDNHTFILTYCCDVPVQSRFVNQAQIPDAKFKCIPYPIGANDDIIVAGIQNALWIKSALQKKYTANCNTLQTLFITLPKPGYTKMDFIIDQSANIIGIDFPVPPENSKSLFIPSSSFTKQIHATLEMNGYRVKKTPTRQMKDTSRINLVIYQALDEIKMIANCFVDKLYTVK